MPAECTSNQGIGSACLGIGGDADGERKVRQHFPQGYERLNDAGLDLRRVYQ